MNNRNLMAIYLAFTACAPPSGECVGSGVRLTEPTTAAECQAFLSAWEHGKDVLRPRLLMTDRMLEGSSVKAREAPWYIEGWGMADGALWCGQNYFEIAVAGRPWCMTALLHEQIHAVECNNPDDANHNDWGKWKQALVNKELKCGL